MTIFVFLGPTLAVEEARRQLDAIYLPPARVGDVYRAALEAPFAIGIIDGFFERVPSVWHKEILWAISRGIHVFGSASMGALRAAELHTFGMHGVGTIFEAFRSGDLEDDDEVAVSHEEASRGYRPTSEAMVNVRATLLLAEERGVIPHELRVALEKLAKNIFYPERSYPTLLAHARAERGNLPELEALKAFLVSNRADVKRADAVALLTRLGKAREANEPARPASFKLANSEPWTQLRAWARGGAAFGSELDTIPPSLIAAEARRLGESGRTIVAGAFTRAVAAASSLGSSSSAALRKRFSGELDEHIVLEARESGVYHDLARRARHKQTTLAQHGLTRPTVADANLPAAYVVDWYLSALGCEVSFTHATSPDFLHSLGFSSAFELELEALREFLYARLVPQAEGEF